MLKAHASGLYQRTSQGLELVARPGISGRIYRQSSWKAVRPLFSYIYPAKKMSPSHPSIKLGVESWKGVSWRVSGPWETRQRWGHHPESMGVWDCPTLSPSPSAYLVLSKQKPRVHSQRGEWKHLSRRWAATEGKDLFLEFLLPHPAVRYQPTKPTHHIGAPTTFFPGPI